MADFRTHIQVASVASGLLAGSLAWAQLVTLPEAGLLWLAGTLGGILPDIDADTSRSIRIIFRLFGILGTMLALLYGRQYLPLVDTLVLGAVAYVLVRYPLCWAFARFTVHRGTLHSLLANLVFAGGGVVISSRLFQLPAELAWQLGIFVFIGAMIHLLLDELYSIDLEGRRLKKSFGTALKITEWRSPLANLLLLSLLAACWWLAPTAPSLLLVLQRLLPLSHI
ncbi:metal-dependent hydrolase [Oceanisphaera sediminis]|uniref:Metal-dependent hydrolase n=1 Tax=Oceanisphaera sediminis TaxID=981381 RepID=A0ABP7DAQ4_9GAMM|nr:metal-dependent hydrolase [uncultured Oceanisphaera sp.]